MSAKALVASAALFFASTAVQAQYLHVITKDGKAYEFNAEQIASAYVDNESTLAPKQIDGHDYVDLGTGVKWATMNVGASSVTEKGDLFAWGELTPSKKTYSWSNYTWANGSSDSYITKYTVDDEQTDGQWYTDDLEFVGDGKSVLEAADDTATKLFGASWRMPSPKDFENLVKNCYAVSVSEYDGVSISGIVVYKRLEKDATAKTAANFFKSSCAEDYNTADCTHIFLPSAGYKRSTSLSGTANGYYWANSLSVNADEAATYAASYLNFKITTTSKTVSYEGVANRYYGYSVRPVAD